MYSQFLTSNSHFPTKISLLCLGPGARFLIVSIATNVSEANDATLRTHRRHPNLLGAFQTPHKLALLGCSPQLAQFPPKLVTRQREQHASIVQFCAFTITLLGDNDFPRLTVSSKSKIIVPCKEQLALEKFANFSPGRLSKMID
jgi:hypothetical protein